jgi:hypothetical protein
VKVGDLVKLIMAGVAHENQHGLILERKILQSEYRFDVMLATGKIISGIPERYVEVISESR